MEKTGFCFDTVGRIDFIRRKFVTSGFNTAEENAIREEVEARSGYFSKSLVLDADYLIVKESHPVLTKKYLRALDMKKRGYPVTVIPGSVFSEQIQEAPGEPLSLIPVGGGRLHFHNTLWAFSAIGFSEDRYCTDLIGKNGGLIETHFSEYTQYLIYDPVNIREETLEKARAREKEGTLVILPWPVFRLWAPERVTEEDADSLSDRDTRCLIQHFLSHQASWNSSVNGAPEAVAALLRQTFFYVLDDTETDPETVRLCSEWVCRNAEKRVLIGAHTYLADLFYRNGCFEALFLLIDLLCEEEKDWVGSGRSDGLYTYSLAAGYLGKALESGDTQTKAQFLAHMRERFPEAAGRGPLPELELRQAADPYEYWVPGAVRAFGTYVQGEQDSGPEPIEWTVLEVKDGTALLLSRYALEVAPFSDSVRSAWGLSSLREWLNSAFVEAAFSAEEQKAIVPACIAAEKVPGPDTTDRVFLLSVREAMYYLGPDEDRRCALTPYARSHNADILYSSKKDGRYTCCWWLRSAGRYGCDVAFVNHYGFTVEDGHFCGTKGYGVRPAVWVSLP